MKRNEKSTVLIEFDSYIERQREKEQDKYTQWTAGS